MNGDGDAKFEKADDDPLSADSHRLHSHLQIHNQQTTTHTSHFVHLEHKHPSFSRAKPLASSPLGVSYKHTRINEISKTLKRRLPAGVYTLNIHCLNDMVL